MNNLKEYEKNVIYMRTGDLLLWKSHDPLGAAIRLFSNANVNHASLILCLEERDSKLERHFTTEATGQGVVINLLDMRIAEFDGEVWWYPLLDEWNNMRTSIFINALKYIGVEYDFPGLFWNIFEKPEADDSKLFCSEYCFLCYGMEGKAPRPGDMEALGIFKKGVKIL